MCQELLRVPKGAGNFLTQLPHLWAKHCSATSCSCLYILCLLDQEQKLPKVAGLRAHHCLCLSTSLAWWSPLASGNFSVFLSTTWQLPASWRGLLISFGDNILWNNIGTLKNSHLLYANVCLGDGKESLFLREIIFIYSLVQQKIVKCIQNAQCPLKKIQTNPWPQGLFQLHCLIWKTN